MTQPIALSEQQDAYDRLRSIRSQYSIFCSDDIWFAYTVKSLDVILTVLERKIIEDTASNDLRRSLDEKGQENKAVSV